MIAGCEVCGPPMADAHDVATAAEAIAEEAGCNWHTLSYGERVEYEQQARAAIVALGVEFDNGKGL